MSATYIVPLTGITLMAVGLLGVGIAAWRSHKVSTRLDFIRSLGSEAELYSRGRACRRTRAGATRQPHIRTDRSCLQKFPLSPLPVE